MANSTQKFIESNMVGHWSKTVWPPYSPDLNALDYGIWGVMQAKVNASSHKNKSALTRTIWQEWNRLSEAMIRLSEAMIRRTCCAFMSHLEKVVAADGGYIN
jgi:hypothetical protein